MAALDRLFYLAWFIFIGDTGINPLTSASGSLFNRPNLHLLWMELDDRMAVVLYPGDEANNLVPHWQYSLSHNPEIPQDSGNFKKVHIYLVGRGISPYPFNFITWLY